VKEIGEKLVSDPESDFELDQATEDKLWNMPSIKK